MDKHHDKPTMDGSLPRPVVLSPDELSAVAAAGSAMAVAIMPGLASPVIRAGGISVGPMVS